MRKKVFFKAFLLLAGVLSILSSFAQDRAISGTVTDEKGTTLPGATISVKGTKISTTTGVDGKFSLHIPQAAKAVTITFIGMQSQDVSIGNQTDLRVTLRSGNASTLNDVVVIGYGTQRRADVNGAISSVTAKDIADIPQASVDQMLEGKAAGVNVTQNAGSPGSATSVHIRGVTSFGSTEPLYVIDGVAIQGSAQAGIQLSRPGGGDDENTVSPLAQLNPNDIESIDILKDASATAIYGSRAANGVVMITTKRGKSGTGKITYDGWYGSQEQGKFLKMANLQQYAVLQNELSEDFFISPRTEFANPAELGPGTNWQKAIFQHAPEQSHSLAFSGGTDRSDYYLSGGYFDQDGTILGFNFKRWSIHSAVNSKLKDWFKVGMTLNANSSNENVGVSNVSGVVYNALLAAPDNAVYNADGTFAGPAVINGVVEGGLNPVQQALSITNNLVRNNIQGSAYGDIMLPLGFTIHSEIDGNFDWNSAKTFLPTYAYGVNGSTPAFNNSQASLTEYQNNDSYWNWVEHLNYNHTFGGKHVVTALIGHEAWESQYDGIQATTKGFTAGNTIQTLGLGTQSTNQETEPKGDAVMESFLARIIYTYDNKYSITATDRRDQSDRFATGHQIGYFPGIAGSWRISQEHFMDNVKFADNVKIRAGYGTVGNASIQQYAYGSSINPITTGLGTGFSVNNFNNLGLTWETAIQTDIGLDFSILHNRIDVSADWYDKTSSGFLFQPPLPAFLAGGVAEFSSAGVVQPPFENTGKIQNKGYEATVTSRNIVNKDFRWTTTAIFSAYTNKVVSLSAAPFLLGQIASGGGANINLTETHAGDPVGAFYGYKTQGIITTMAQLNQLALHPQNVTGAPSVVTNNRTVANGIWLGDEAYQGTDPKGNGSTPNPQYRIGSPQPKFTYSMTNTFNYKDFDFSIFVIGVYGDKIFNALKLQTEALDGLYSNQLASALNFWTPSNPNSTLPAPRGTFGNNNTVISNRYVESGSYLRIQNLRLGYNLPNRYARMAKMTHLRAYVSGQNLWVITKYSGLDPEIGSLNQNPLLTNVDNGRYPIPRVVTFGINAEF
jgi:TonB-linked SusC/RagA family outer membrane protein